ncbi:MAG: MlaD family protein [Solirubrobacteraceae bacterium]
MRRRGSSSIAANPVLIGAATTLVVIVAVFLAYNANNGLPFVPTYQLNAEVPNAANLVRGNDVRMGGARIGVVDEITPVNHKDGTATAKLKLKLQTSVDPLPKNSTVLIRPRSALGLKYVAITKGNLPVTGDDNAKRNGFADGATIPLKNATPQPVEIDEVFNTFDKPTRDASETNLTEFGNALAGRGQDLNDAIALAPSLLGNLIPVMNNLSDPATRLNNLFPALERAASIVAPAAQTQADLFVNLDTTFSALADVARPFIQESISNGPPALNTAIRTLPFQRVFLANTEQLVRDLRPGIRALSRAAPAASEALTVGTPALLRSVALNRRLQTTFRTIQAFSEDPRVSLGLGDLTTTVQLLNPILKSLAPVQLTCNYITLWFRNVASLLSEGDSNGTWQRVIVVALPTGPDNEGGPSSAPANGPETANHLHNNPYPNVGAPGEDNECEAGNEKYLAGQTVLGNVPGNQGTAHDETKRDLNR